MCQASAGQSPVLPEGWKVGRAMEMGCVWMYHLRGLPRKLAALECMEKNETQHS